jgi:hypothetical protein
MFISVLLGLSLAASVHAAQTTTGSATWDIDDLSLGGNFAATRLLLDFSLNPDWVSIPVNGYIETNTGNALVVGTAVFDGDGALLIHLNSSFSVDFYVQLGDNFSGEIGLYNPDGTLFSFADITFAGVR